MKEENKIKNKWRIKRIAMLPLVAICSVLLFKYFTDNKLTIVNNSSQKAQKVIVSICGKDIIFKNINPNEKQLKNFSIYGDSGINVNVTLEDKTELDHNFGYVTGGAGAYRNHIEIELTPDGKIKGKQN